MMTIKHVLWIFTSLALLAFSSLRCGGSVEQDEPLRQVLPPLSVECVQHEDCLPATLGYATCLEGRCSFRCWGPSGVEDENPTECEARGGVCVDIGGEHAWCSPRR